MNALMSQRPARGRPLTSAHASGMQSTLITSLGCIVPGIMMLQYS